MSKKDLEGRKRFSEMVTTSVPKVLVDDIEQFLTQKMVQLNTALVENLYEDTPVDTGFARSNWIPTIGAPFSDVFGDRDTNVSDARQEAGLAELKGYTPTQLAKSLWIANNVKYIKLLNAGTSSQAPAAFVERAISISISEVSL